jgi:hypothetical protein
LIWLSLIALQAIGPSCQLALWPITSTYVKVVCGFACWCCVNFVNLLISQPSNACRAIPGQQLQVAARVITSQLVYSEVPAIKVNISDKQSPAKQQELQVVLKYRFYDMVILGPMALSKQNDLYLYAGRCPRQAQLTGTGSQSEKVSRS